MILGTPNNTQVSAPQITDADTMLAGYRNFAQNINLTKDDLYKFLTSPGSDRNEFLKQYDASVELQSNRFIEQTF